VASRAPETVDRRRLSSVPGEDLGRWALEVDAVVSGLNGVVYVAAAGALDSLLGVSTTMLRAVGAFLVLYASLVGIVATRRPLVPAAVRWVIAANVVWVIASLVFVAAGWSSPTTTGAVWIVLQAVTVAGFAAAQGWGLRRP